MVQAVGAANRFRVPILHALYELGDEQSAKQWIEIGRCYAKTGDESFRSLLYDIVERRPFPCWPDLGASDLIRLDGEKAFLSLARNRGRTLSNRAWDYDDDVLVFNANDILGESRVRALLETSTENEVQSFFLGH